MNKDEMDGNCSTVGGENYIQNFGWKISREETNLETWM
jgi:hypothetical protein